MQVKIFGRTGCPRCETAREKLDRFVAERRIQNRVEVAFYDIDTPQGLAEGLWHEIGSDTPVVVIHRESADEGLADPLAGFEG